MLTPFRLLVAYDGSPCADTMIEDLRFAGIPTVAQVLVVSVSERTLPPPAIHEIATMPLQERGKDHAVRLAILGATRIASRHPEWTIEHEGHTGSPARVILQRARQWNARLVVAGSLGYNAIQLLFIGSISQKVANEAHCSVRVSRGRHQSGTLRLLLAFDARPRSAMAAAAIAGRNWPKGTEIHLIAATGFNGPPLGECILPLDQGRVKALLEPAIEMLEKSGLRCYATIQEADPKNLVVEEAARLKAHCIFTGCNDHSLVDELLLGTVSNALISRAPCAVEVVR